MIFDKKNFKINKGFRVIFWAEWGKLIYDPIF
jgi:hypothetical protein